MKSALASGFVCLFFYGLAFAGPYDAFNYVLNRAASEKKAQEYLDVFTEDVGQAVSGGSYGFGGSLGIRDLDLTLSLKMSYQDVSGSNAIVRTSGDSAIYYPIIQADIGLIQNLGAVFRLSHFNASSLMGGGLRYNLLESEEKMYIPSVSVQSVYNYLIYNENDYGKFNLWNLKSGITAYFVLIPYIQPYVFLTYDITALHPVSSRYSGLSSQQQGFGYGAGANIKTAPLNISVSVSIYENCPNVSFGAFIGI